MWNVVQNGMVLPGGELLCVCEQDWAIGWELHLRRQYL